MKLGKHLALGLVAVCLMVSVSSAAPFKVLVVMSYEETMPWVKDIKEGIDTRLKDRAETTYVFLDTRRNYDQGPEAAEKAYQLFQDMNPDGVIAADDNAQAMFVVPYLKDKVETPVVFCGVNALPEEYGYPSKNVTGILERIHYLETIAFLQQIVPSVKTVAYLLGDNKTAQGFIGQAKREMDSFPAKSVAFETAQTIAEALEKAEALRENCDALFVDNISGLKDENGAPVDEPTIIPRIVDVYGKPTFCANRMPVEIGVLCAVIKTGQNQGDVAARMLLQAMEGTPIADIPVTRNRQGKRLINGTTMMRLGIKPNASFLVGAEIVR